MSLGILQTLIEADAGISLWINGFHCAYADNLMEMFSGVYIWVPFYLALAVFVFRNFPWKVALTFLLLSLLLLVMDDQISSSVIRPAVGRLRPSNLANPISSFIHVSDGYRGWSYGFAYAHAANCWGMVFFVFHVFRRGTLTATMIIWATIVCYSRMYLGVHYFGDVLAGMLLGAFNSTIVYFLFRYSVRHMSDDFRSREISAVQLWVPAFVLVAELALMMVLATFVNPT